MTKEYVNREERRKLDVRRKLELKEKSKKNRLTNKRKVELLKKVESIDSSMADVIKELVDIEIKKYDQKLSQAMDRCFTAAMIDKTPYSLEEINRIFEYSYMLIEEDVEKIKILMNEGGGDWMRAADKYQEEVKERVMQLIEKGTKDKIAKEILIAEFPKLSKSMISNAFKKIKEQIAKEKLEDDQEANNILDNIDSDVKEGLEKIFPEEFEKMEENKISEKAMKKRNTKIQKIENEKVAKEVNRLSDKQEVEKVIGESVKEAISISKDIEVVSMKVRKELEANTEFGLVRANTDEGIKFVNPNAEMWFGDQETLMRFYQVGKKIFEMI